MRLVTAAEMRVIESAAGTWGVDAATLLVQAGTAVADRLGALYGTGRNAVVLVGKGNNGGDALVASRRLAELYRWRVTTVVVANREADDHLAALHKPELHALVTVVAATANSFERALEAVERALLSADVVIDGLLGIGATGPLRGQIAAILDRCDAVPAWGGQARIAIDIPSGVDANTGEAAAGAFCATRTLSTGPAKPGCFVGEGGRLAGFVDVLDIGLPDAVWPLRQAVNVEDDGTMRRVTAREAAVIVPARPNRSHKGSFGRVLVVGGSARYPGAPVLAALGAVHGGAGVVSVARPTLASRVNLPPEVVAASVEVAGDAFGPDDVQCLVAASARARAVVVGPGLGTEARTIEAVRLFVGRLSPSLPVVIDADGLNALAGTMDGRNAQWVVTPHAAEMSRLAAASIAEVIRDPISVAREAAQRWGVVVVLKGAPTVIATPRGTVAVGAYANAALATGGSGDVLAGLVGALFAQRLTAWHAAVAGVATHAVAGEFWRRHHGSSGARASQLAAFIPDAAAMVARMA